VKQLQYSNGQSSRTKLSAGIKSLQELMLLTKGWQTSTKGQTVNTLTLLWWLKAARELGREWLWLTLGDRLH
jgi:hypothetical protein